VSQGLSCGVLSAGLGAAIALVKAGAALSDMGLPGLARTDQNRHLRPRPGRSVTSEANDIFWRELGA
jgi:hypothetical protein